MPGKSPFSYTLNMSAKHSVKMLIAFIVFLNDTILQVVDHTDQKEACTWVQYFSKTDARTWAIDSNRFAVYGNDIITLVTVPDILMKGERVLYVFKVCQECQSYVFRLVLLCSK